MSALYANSETKRIIDFLDEHGPASRREIAEALGKTKEAVREVMRGSHFYFEVAEQRPYPQVGGIENFYTTRLRVGDWVEWTHTNPLGHSWLLQGEIIGGDWDGLHVTANGLRFAVPASQLQMVT